MLGDNSIPLDVARRLDQLCMEFERQWQTAQRPRLEEFLAGWDGPRAHRSLLLEELLHVELEALQQIDAAPPLHQYLARFPDDVEVVQKVFSARSELVDIPELTATFIPAVSAAKGAQPDRIGRYEVEREIGRGSFGVVYRARDPQLDCFVAIKQLRIDRVATATGAAATDVARIVEKLLREARLAAKLRRYEGIVAVLDVLTSAEADVIQEIYFVQELIEGGDLKSLIAEGPVSPVDAAQILQRVAQAMGHVHEHGICHRDLKPGNVILDSNGNPFVVDFGLAVDATIQRQLRGDVSGTLPYMAPEQIRGEVHLLDGRADIWALGVILYEMLTGRRPFQGKSQPELFDEICHREARPPRLINPHLPAELERICLKCLSKRMTDRYPTAADLSDDLQKWIVEYESGPVADAVERRAPAKIVPKGLRSFDEDDADFFLELLPGPRDRDGLPESIRFWRQRIEQKDPDETFRVGLLYGPSGCGKSSFVKAGLLPRLNRIAPIYVESTAADTEARTIRQLRKIAPQLPRDLSLPDAMRTVRERPELTGFKKTVLILDQFEQWLQSRRAFGREQLVEMLRQCDGSRVQALILVRDDFWMAVTRFLQELEVDLIPGKNVTAVDLFPRDHARRVLTAYGRAYAKIDEQQVPTAEQQLFIDKVVEGLSVDGTIVCVRLAIFAEMVKNKEWNPRTIDQVGGTTGVGESFLEDAFVTRTANPRHRVHQRAARNVLQALLPEVGTNIKGHMKSYAQLLDVSGYEGQLANYHELLRILDSELRLITPTDPEGSGGEDPRNLDCSYFQLTHDYLVPSLRAWLTRRRRATRKGRAQLLMAELAETWRQKPDSRHLPSPLEWMSIVWWTRRSERTDAQQNMVRSCTRRLARNAGLLVLGLVITVYLVFQYNGRLRSRAAVNRLVNADTNDLPLIMSDIQHYRLWTEPLLVQKLSALNDEPTPADFDEADRKRRQGIHLELALAALDPAQASAVFDRLSEVPIENLPTVAELLEPHRRHIVQDLWRRYFDNKDQAGVLILRFASVLANIEPTDQHWASESEFLVEQLMMMRPSDAVLWRQQLRPVGSILIPAFVGRAGSKKPLTTAHRAMLIDFIIDYASHSPELLVKTIETAEPEELSQLLTELDQHSEEAVKFVNARLDALEPDEVEAAPAALIGDDLLSAVTRAEGAVATSGLMVQRLPRDKFNDLDDRLNQAGFTTACLRPYRDGDQLFVSAGWQRTRGLRQVQWDLRLDEIDEVDRQMRERGLLPIDFARYPITDSSEMRWVIVWAAPKGPHPDVRFVTSTTVSNFRKQVEEWPTERFSISRFAIWLTADGEPRCSVIWKQGDVVVSDSFADWRYARAFGDLSPGTLQSDLRFELIAPEQRDRFGIFKQLSFAQDIADTTPSDKERDNKLLAVSKYYSSMGDYPKARAILVDLYPKWQAKSSLIHEYLGVNYARSGNREKLPLAAKKYATFPKARPVVSAYLNLRASVLANDERKTKEYLEHLQAITPKTSELTETLARAYAVLASVESDSDARKHLVDESVSRLRELVTSGQVEMPDVLIFDVDFDPIRNTPQFRELFFAIGLHQRLSTAFEQSVEYESQQLWGLAPAEHLARARKLLNQGFRPNVVAVRADQTEQNRVCGSVWRRPVADVNSKVQLARRKANLLLTAARFGELERFREVLAKRDQPEVRSRLTLYASEALPTARLLEILTLAQQEGEIQSLIMMLGSIPASQFEARERDALVKSIQKYASSEYVSVRSAALWALQYWNVDVSTRNQQPDAATVEFQNAAGQRMLIVSPPEKFLMGSPQWEDNRDEQETRYWTSIPRIYALAATETTRSEFRTFLQDRQVQRHYARQKSRFGTLSANDKGPMVGVLWEDAAKFCQWLSERDPDIPETEYCYPGIWNVDADKIELPKDYLQRRGYRLPTEAEWEFAARSGEYTAIRYCGNDDRLLPGYEWFAINSRGAAHSVMQLRPNNFGFFDLMGNVNEWCDDTYDAYRLPLDGYLRRDTKSNPFLPVKSDWCMLRGGSYLQSPEELRSANRSLQLATYRSPSVGFRVCRTWIVPAEHD